MSERIAETMAASFTPGPWIVSTAYRTVSGKVYFDIIPAGRPGVIAGRILDFHNASLIAAAPELLAALLAAREAFELRGLTKESDWPHHPSLIDEIDLAIARAMGW